MDFPGVALVTGAASGIGKATALRYAQDGCRRIVIADINADLIHHAKYELQKNYPEVHVLDIVVDVRRQESVQAMVDEALKEFGRIDYCANVAGIIREGDTATLSVHDWEDVYQINLRGVFFCAKAEIRAMLSQEPLLSKDSPFPARGAIVNVASQAGLMGNGDLVAYVAAKHGVVGLSKSDGLKYAIHGIRVNALCPGSTETPLLDSLSKGPSSISKAETRLKDIAIGRLGLPEEIAHCIVFLSSGRSSFVTATTLAAHGGLQV